MTLTGQGGEILAGMLPIGLIGNAAVSKVLGAWISRVGPIATTVATDEIYENTLCGGSGFRPWAFEGGRFAALEHRRRFVADYIADPDGFDPARTDYHAFIESAKVRGFAPPYEGCAAWAYADADGLCRRYMGMVDLVLDHLSHYQEVTARRYLRHVRAIRPELAALERNQPVRVFDFADRREVVRRESGRYAEAERADAVAENVVGHLMPSAIVSKGKCILWNGSHRLAIFKALADAGMRTTRFPVAIFAVKNADRAGGTAAS